MQNAWDFSKVPAKHLWQCWGYEFARHVPWVRELYAKAEPWRVDEGGNCWRYHRDRDQDGEHILSLCLAPGFPELPFMEAVKSARFPELRYTYGNGKPGGGMTVVRELRDGEKLGSQQRELRLKLAVNWLAPDKMIVKQLAEIVKRARPFAPIEKRGRSSQRRYESELKALGAFRLLRAGFSAGEAKAKTGLYQQEGEWSEAKRKTLRIFQEEFGIAPSKIINHSLDLGRKG